jgi:hypothetical protein
MHTGVHLELLGEGDKIGNPLLGLSDKYSGREGHASLAGGSKGSSDLDKNKTSFGKPARRLPAG